MYSYNRKYIEHQIVGPFLVLNTLVFLFITFLMITISQNSKRISDSVSSKLSSEELAAWVFNQDGEDLLIYGADPSEPVLEQCRSFKNTVLAAILPSGACPAFGFHESKMNFYVCSGFSFNNSPLITHAVQNFYFSKEGAGSLSLHFLDFNRNSESNLSPFQKKALPFHPIITEAAQRYEVEPAIIKAIIMAESSFNPKAVSQKGAQGLMQLMPRTAKYLGVKDSFNPEHNIDGGVKYFKRLLDRFDGDIPLALAAYNAGSRNVRKYNGVPPFKATQVYIQKVLKYYEQYKTT